MARSFWQPVCVSTPLASPDSRHWYLGAIYAQVSEWTSALVSSTLWYNLKIWHQSGVLHSMHTSYPHVLTIHLVATSAAIFHRDVT